MRIFIVGRYFSSRHATGLKGSKNEDYRVFLAKNCTKNGHKGPKNDEELSEQEIKGDSDGYGQGIAGAGGFHAEAGWGNIANASGPVGASESFSFHST
jgi:hypothetical protein